MFRTIEVGRAVLASPTHRLELWLTTLITILTSQHSIDIQQLSSHALFNLLSSGNVWVGRGNGMCVELEITLRGEPLQQRQLQRLAESILTAPIWAQFDLEPTLPTDALPHGRIVRININHRDSDRSSEEANRHRIFSKVPAADVQPPNGVPKFQVRDVRFSMDILESKQRPQSKRPKTSLMKSNESQLQYKGAIECDEHPGTMLDEMGSPANASSLQEAGAAPSAATLPTNRKRRRPGTHSPTRTRSQLPASSTRGMKARISPVTAGAPLDSVQQTPSEVEVTEICLMVDGAMRLSIYGLNKAPNGLKVVANTFSIGLADAIPILWRPGYLAALSQRAHLLSTIRRSISQVSEVRVTSVSLSEKIQGLTAPASLGADETQRSQNQATKEEAGKLTPSISSRLWLHLQKTLAKRTPPSLQAFVASVAEVSNQPDLDEMLDPVDGPSGQDGLGIEPRETSNPAIDNKMQHTSPVVSPGTQMGHAEEYKATKYGHKRNTADNEGDIETPTAVTIVGVEDSRDSKFDILQHNSKGRSYPIIKRRFRGSSEYAINKATDHRLSDSGDQALHALIDGDQSFEEDLLFNSCAG